MGIENVFGAGVLGVAQAGTNALLTERNAELQRDLYDYTARQAYMYGERSADRADLRTRLLYQDLYSPQAQMQQIKDAGLSPSLFYGDMAGTSGQAGAMGTGATGAQTNAFGISPIELADINLKNAQARKIEEETKTEKGTNERGTAEINSIIENTNNVLLKNVWQEYENSLAEIQTTVEASLQETKIYNYIKQTEYLAHLTNSAETKAEIDAKSKNSVIDYLTERTKNLVADTLLKESEKTLKNAQVKLTKEQINDLISQITTRETQVDINQDWLESQVEQWGIQNGLTKDKNEAEIKQIKHLIKQNWVKRGIELIDVLTK